MTSDRLGEVLDELERNVMTWDGYRNKLTGPPADNLPRVVGICGRRRVGKDEAGRHLERTYGYRTVKFAHPLKMMLRSFLHDAGADPDTVERMIEGDLKHAPSPALAGRTPRYAMQTLGTDWGRNMMGTDLWLPPLLRTINRKPRAIVTDIRFQNEVDAIRMIGGVVIKIVRPALQIELDVDGHTSEAGIDDLIVDYWLYNDNALIDLHRQLDHVLKAPVPAR